MNRIVVLPGLFLLFASCGKQPDPGRIQSDSDSLARIGDTVWVDRPMAVDTVSDIVNDAHAAVNYRINRTTREVMRIFSGKDSTYQFVTLRGRSYKWDTRNGYVNEFTGDYIFSDIYRGDGYGGTITKLKFKAQGGKLQFIDSLTGGDYSEGAGTWEWLVSDSGGPVGIAGVGDWWFQQNNRLLINPSSSGLTHLIHMDACDTLFTMSRAVGDFNCSVIFPQRVLIFSEHGFRNNFLKSYNARGELEWSTWTGRLPFIVADTTQQLVVGACYHYFNNYRLSWHSQHAFVTAYDLKTGKILWTVPMHQGSHGGTNANSRGAIALFQVNRNMYAIITYDWSLPNSGKLIFFDAGGHFFTPFNLPDVVLDPQQVGNNQFSVVYKRENEFDIVNKYRTTRFKTYP